MLLLLSICIKNGYFNIFYCYLHHKTFYQMYTNIIMVKTKQMSLGILVVSTYNAILVKYKIITQVYNQKQLFLCVIIINILEVLIYHVLNSCTCFSMFIVLNCESNRSDINMM